MTKKRQIKFTLIRTLVAISIALLVAALLIFISAGGSSPAVSDPKSAARNGSHAQSAMLFRSSFHTATR